MDLHNAFRFRNSNEIVDVFLSDRKHSEVSPGEPSLLYKSKSGLGVRLSVSTYGAEGALLHEDALLCILADIGIPSFRAVEVDGGQ